jgi:hypothetical protein
MNQRDEYGYELISAFLDGELSPDECARVEQLVASSLEHRRMLEDLQAVTRGMQQLPGYHLENDFSQRVIALARQASVGDPKMVAHREFAAAPVPAATAVWHWRAVLGVSAVAAAASLLALFLWNAGTGSIDRSETARITPPESRVATPDESTTARDAHVDTTAGPDRAGSGLLADSDLSHQTPSNARSAQDGAAVSDATSAVSPTMPADSVASDNSLSSAPAIVAADIAAAESMSAEPRPSDIPVAHESDPLARELAKGLPFSGKQQLLLVIDVTLTPQGAQHSAFENALVAHHVAVEDAVPVAPALEEALLRSRFFDPIKIPPGAEAAAPSDFGLVYVRAQAGHVDQIWRTIQSNGGEFAAVSFDMALMPADMLLFQQLRQAVPHPLASAAAVGEAKARERRAAAHRLALSPSWRGTPAQKLKGLESLAGMVPAWMLEGKGAKTPSRNDASGSPRPQAPPSPANRLGENVEAEVLFVVHVGRGAPK